MIKLPYLLVPAKRLGRGEGRGGEERFKPRIVFCWLEENICELFELNLSRDCLNLCHLCLISGNDVTAH